MIKRSGIRKSRREASGKISMHAKHEYLQFSQKTTHPICGTIKPSRQDDLASRRKSSSILGQHCASGNM